MLGRSAPSAAMIQGSLHLQKRWHAWFQAIGTPHRPQPAQVSRKNDLPLSYAGLTLDMRHVSKAEQTGICTLLTHTA